MLKHFFLSITVGVGGSLDRGFVAQEPLPKNSTTRTLHWVFNQAKVPIIVCMPSPFFTLLRFKDFKKFRKRFLKY